MVKDGEKKKKLTVADLKDKLNEDQLDLILSTLDSVPFKEIVIKNMHNLYLFKPKFNFLIFKA